MNIINFVGGFILGSCFMFVLIGVVVYILMKREER